MKAAVFTRREPGGPISPSERDGRDLPAPAMRSVTAAIGLAAAFGERIELGDGDHRDLRRASPDRISDSLAHPRSNPDQVPPKATPIE